MAASHRNLRLAEVLMEIGGFDGACWVSPYRVRVFVGEQLGHSWKRDRLLKMESRFGVTFEVWTHKGHDLLGKLRKGLIYVCIRP